MHVGHTEAGGITGGVPGLNLYGVRDGGIPRQGEGVQGGGTGGESEA